MAGQPALLDGVKTALTGDALFRNAVAQTAHGETDLSVGECMTVAHNFNTRAVVYQTFMTDPTAGNAWIPMPSYGIRDNQTNIALTRPTGSSGNYAGSYVATRGNDGVEGGGCDVAWLPTGQFGWWQVDLGSVTMVSRVRVLAADGGCDDTATAWQVQVSSDGSAFTQEVAQGNCVHNGSCNSYVDHNFAPVPAKWVRINVTNGNHPTTNGLFEVQVFGATFPITLPDANSIRLCNYTGLRRTFALRVSL